MYIYKYIYIFRKSEKRKVYPPFKDNIWGADIAVMQWIIELRKYFNLYYVLLILIANMLGIFPLKDKNGITITDAFQNILDMDTNRQWFL